VFTVFAVFFDGIGLVGEHAARINKGPLALVCLTLLGAIFAEQSVRGISFATRNHLRASLHLRALR
jgi:hypothetical protein